MRMVKLDLPKFETKTCGRCGGSGHFSYCQRYGTKCFGCSGSGLQYTKRGAAALAHENTILEGHTVAVEDVQPGQWVHTGDKWIRPSKVEANGPYIAMHTSKGIYNHFPNDKVRLAHTEQERREIRDKALAYQETLTKAGKPRKSRNP